MQPKRILRGPLKALHTTCAEDDATDLHCDYGGYTLPADESFRLAKENAPTTPLMRVHSSNKVGRRQSLQPLRTSSYRDDKVHHLSGVEDIRSHFPIRVSSSKSSTINETNKTSGDCETIVTSPLRSGYKRPGTDAQDADAVTQPKQICYSNQGSEHKLTMGAYVKTHPRYFRRRNSADCMRQSNESIENVCDANSTTLTNRLSPICPVPMPEGFPLQLPLSCATVSLPWEARRALLTPRLPQRTAETQTSPTESTLSNSDQKRSRSKRQSFGSSQMLVGLRKTFGNLRRAISAERLHRSSHSMSDSTKRTSTQKPASPHTTKLKLKPLVSKRSSIQRSSIGVATVSETSNTTTLPRQPEQKNVPSVTSNVSITEGHDTSKLTCHVVGKHLDGSIRVALRRGSTHQQFGFFIARDSEGIYISRLGGVRCAVKYWDVFHVGDRILEVQGTSCKKLEVEDVQNLTRGCELVEFRIKPAHSNAIVHGSSQPC